MLVIKSVSNAVGPFIASVCLMFGILIIAGGMTDYEHEKAFEVGMLSFTIAFGMFLTLLLMIIDKAISFAVSFITDKEEHCEDFITDKIVSDKWMDGGDRFMVISLNLNIYLLIITVSVLFPSTLFVTIPVVGTVLLIYGLLVIARKVYRINKRLNEHVNDDKIHNHNHNQ
jgi:Ca2+/Na+ antiporter